jgi:hypothetical protein
VCAAQSFLSVDPASFSNDGTLKKIYTKINETWTIAKMDLVREVYIHCFVPMRKAINEARYTHFKCFHACCTMCIHMLHCTFPNVSFSPLYILHCHLLHVSMTERCMQMFFPIIFQDHWVLLCVSMFMKQIAFFDSLSASKESSCLKCAQNLVSGSVDSLLFILLLLK